MLLCSRCHKQIDDQVNAYPEDRLLEIKRGHEAWAASDSGIHVEVDTSFLMFPGLIRDQMLDQLSRAQLPAEQANQAQQLIQFQAQFAIPHDFACPVSPELMAVMPPEVVMVVATITNAGRTPVTIQRCHWQTSQPDMTIGTINQPPGVTFPHRLGENDSCISVISLASIMAILDAPLRDKSVTEREAWPMVEVANLRKPVRGNSLVIPTRNSPTAQTPTAP
jgi:hypothetical protein